MSDPPAPFSFVAPSFQDFFLSFFRKQLFPGSGCHVQANANKFLPLECQTRFCRIKIPFFSSSSCRTCQAKSRNSLTTALKGLSTFYLARCGIKRKQKMTGGTPEVRSDKSLSFLPFDIWQWSYGPVVQWSYGLPDQWTNGPMDPGTKGPMVQWTNSLMDHWTNGTLDQWNIGTLQHPNTATFEHCQRHNGPRVLSL